MVAAAVLLAIVAVQWSPRVPVDAAAVPIARTELTGPVAPDAAPDGANTDRIPRSPSGQKCVPRLERRAGYMDVCWAAYRYPADSDPDKDYYLLRVWGTFGRGADGSPRWAVLKADLEGEPADSVLSAWPDGEFDATCEPTSVVIELVDPMVEETLCGHIRTAETETWTHSVTWTCEGCLLPDDLDRPLSLYVAVAVPPGTVPSWTISADVGD